MRKMAWLSPITVGLLLAGLALQASAASRQEELKKVRAEIRKEAGSRLPPLPIPANNPQTKDKVRLGEALFFDPNLSSCATVACATCHLPEMGFSDGKAVSTGCQGATGRRNSQTVYQSAYMSHLFWDGRVQSVEQQALNPVVDPVEMANTWDNVLAYLKTGVHPATGKSFPEAKQFYETYFGKTFEGEISTTTVAKAIGAYERTVNSTNSPFDRWVQGNDKALTERQKKGLLVFFGRGKCSGCHAPPHFTNSDFHTPTLRNVALSAPYMHNGKLATLEAVMTHYEELAKGTISPLLGELDADVRKGATLFGVGGGEADDLANMVEFMRALTGSQRAAPKGGVAPPRP